MATKTSKGPKSFESLRNDIEARLEQTAQKKQKTLKNRKPSGDVESSKDSLRGKKRDHKGNVVKPNGLGPKDDGEEDEFVAEVRALGGTEEDIEFLAGVESDSEYEENETSQDDPNRSGKKSKDFQTGIDNIMKEFALSQGKMDETADADEEPESEAVEEEEKPVPKEEAPNRKNKGRLGGLKCEPRPDWYSLTNTVAPDDLRTSILNGASIESLEDHAKYLLREENEAYKQKTQKSSSQSFYNTVITSGTLSDKISALTLAAQESPIHNVKALEVLIGLASKRSRSQAVDVLRALKDLFAQGSLLPSSRRLYSFSTQPALHASFAKVKSWRQGEILPKGVDEQQLIAWEFESWLKGQYFEMLKILETWCNDEIEFAKSKAISYVYELLKEKPEQESNLLRLLVNKLGDPIKKIASQTSYLLMQLLQTHPAMKQTVVSAIETDFIFRPGQSLHGKYYAIVTLNQTALSVKEEDVAIKLLGIYFSLFSGLLKVSPSEEDKIEDKTEDTSSSRGQRRHQKKKTASTQPQEEDLREKLTSALLTGVNRAYPYADAHHQKFAEHIDTLFKITHSANFNTSIQAMLLIQQLASAHQPSNDRFYRVLYESLLDPRLISASKHQLYLNLLHRALKADLNVQRVKAFVKRILQILHLHESSFICATIFLLKDLEKSFPGLSGLLDDAEELDDGEEVFQDVDDDRNEPQVPEPNSEEHSQIYDGHKRAPEHANADRSCAWEALPFLAHFHPSVTVAAEAFVHHEKLPGKPDLTLHTLMHFLDRFVYKNAKLSEIKPRGSSIMQPMASDNNRGVFLGSTTKAASRIPVNSEDFKAKKEKNVAAEDVFFHKYFNTIGKESKKKTTKKAKMDEDDVINSDEEDDVWKAMLNSAPDLGGVGDSDADLDMSDLESAMGSDMESDEQDEALGPELKDLDDDEDGVDIEPGIFNDSDDEMANVDGLESDIDDEVVTEEALPKHKTGKERKKMKSMPTFASAEDYAKMLDAGDDDEDY